MPAPDALPVCAHCRQPMPSATRVEGESRGEVFCCAGCAAVYRLLHDAGLERYYSLAGAAVTTPPETAPHGFDWLVPLVAESERGTTPLCALELDVQGIHCAGCVWLLDETFRRRQGGVRATVNPGLGKVHVVWRRGVFDVAAWVAEIERFGYRFGPSRKRATRASLELPLRLGVSAALTVNGMLFSLSFYFGLAPADGGVFRLFTWLAFALATGVVLVGGWPFLRSAARGLRSGLLHLDLPIATGILLVYALSLAQMRQGRGDVAYFDTLDVFICLMLAGRLLQERVLERNRHFLLEDEGADGIAVRVVRGDAVQVIAAPAVLAGDRLLVAPGDLLPTAATLEDGEADVRTDWITGEPDVTRLRGGAEIPAGAFNAGRRAFTAVARTDFAASPLVALLRRPAASRRRAGAHRRPWDRLARVWSAAVLGLAALGFLLWLPRGFDAAANVAAALLVVTCPCALGIAIPFAYELTQASLRRQRFFARSEDLLDRLARVRTVLFDKTGTLTLGRLELAHPEAVGRLEPRARRVAYNLAARSGHPVSVCLAAALAPTGVALEPAAVEEEPGRGLVWRRADGTWRLGAAAWAAAEAPAGAVTVLSRDGVVVADVSTREVQRADAAREVAALAAAGYAVWLLSGDGAARVLELARALGVSPEHARGGLLPAEKAACVAALDADDTLYLGDGINDALAFDAAYACGTPALDRPALPGRSDFFLLGPGIAPVGRALLAARRLRRVVRGLLVSSLAYNAVTVGLALSGLMSPLLAAVLMPASTLLLLTRTAWALSERRAAPARRPAAMPELAAGGATA